MGFSAQAIALGLLLLLATQVQATDVSDRLRTMEKDIFENPWSVYARLQDMAPKISKQSRETQVLYYLRRAHALQFLYLHSDFEESIDQGIQLISSNTPVRHQVFLYTLSGVKLQREGNYFEAIRSQAAAVELARGHNLRFAATFSLVELAYSEALQGNHDSALRHLAEANNLADQLDDLFAAAMIDEVYGVVLSYMNNFDDSIKRYKSALNVYRNLGYLAYEAEAVNGLGITFRYAKRWDEAIAAFQKYEALTQNNGSPHGEFTANYGLGMTYAEKGDCALALPAIAHALNVEGPLDYKAELYKRQAVCLAGQGDRAGAMSALSQARQIFESIPELRGSIWEIDTLKSEALALAKLGEPELAFDKLLAYQEQAIAEARSDAERELLETRVALDNARTNADLRDAREDERLTRLELGQQQYNNSRQQFLLIVAILLATATLMVVIYLRRQNRLLKTLTTTDALTGAHNRRHVFELLEQYTANLPLAVGKLSVMLIDIDNFKLINDAHGHPTGDQVLRELSGLISLVTRNEDVVARIGGEEFLIILPRLGEAEAASVAERLLGEVRRHRFAVGLSHSVHVTLSAGIATFGKRCTNATLLYQCADEALYHSKSAGKDRVTIYSALQTAAN